MQIIQEGNKQSRKFNCKHCDCVFVADIGEYRELLKGKGFVVRCPSCKTHIEVAIKDASLYTSPERINPALSVRTPKISG